MSTNHDGPKPGQNAEGPVKDMNADPAMHIHVIKGRSSLTNLFAAIQALESETQDNPKVGTADPLEKPQPAQNDRPGYSIKNMDVPGFERLALVFRAAYTQAAVGKGVQRHSKHGERFEDQPIFDMAKRFGVGSLLAQAFKKMEESQRLPLESAANELYGAMVYCAAAVIALEDKWVKEAISAH